MSPSLRASRSASPPTTRAGTQSRAGSRRHAAPWMTSSIGNAGADVRAAAFVGRLASAEIGATFNFYRAGDGAELRRSRLREYLEAHASSTLILVGEAAGYRGERVSGIPVTSERQLTGEGPAEATATIVQRTLTALRLAAPCWNLVPTHPGTPSSKRPPTQSEVAAARPFLEQIASGRRVLAVGRLAAAATGARYVRHPSHGGAAEFRAGLLRFAAGGRL